MDSCSPGRAARAPARRRARAGAALLAAALLAPRAALGVGTPAGTPITNRATATYTVGTSALSQTSNDATLTVLEVVDVVATSQDAGPVSVTSPAPGGVLTFLVTNLGNGTEDFALAATNLPTPPDDFDASSLELWIESDGSPGLDPAGDTPYTGPADLRLDANGGASADRRIVYLRGAIPGGLAAGAGADLRLSATSANHPGGAPPPGALLPGVGDGGIDAVLGASAGDGEADGRFVVVDATLEISKSVDSIADPFGGSLPIPGALVRYTLRVRVTGTSTATAVVITDPIPAATTYAAGSLSLDPGSGVLALSDAADADAGELANGPPPEIRVRLGDLAPGAADRTIRFSVTID